MNKNLRYGSMYAALFFALCALIFLRFRDFFPSVFYGDDLAMFMYVHGAESKDLGIAALLAFINTKFRPIFTGALTVETYAFAKHLGRYLIVNVVINALTGVAAFAVFRQLSRSTLISALLAATMMTSRFALYQVTQVTGQVESISLLFFVLTVLCTYKAVVEPDISDVKLYEWLSLFLAALAFHTHERYLVALVWLPIVFSLTRNNVGRWHRLAFLVATAAIVIFNVTVKHFALHAAFFEGTGGQKLAISVPRIIDLSTQAAYSVFGLNTGPEYLIGIRWDALPLGYQTACIDFAIVAALVALAALLWSKRTGAALISFPWLLALVAAMLIAPATMTIRMEQRWELAPFFILLALVARWVGNQTDRSWLRAASLITMSLVVCHVAIDREISEGFPKIFMVSEAAYARAVKDDILASGATSRGENVVLIGEASHCGWGILLGRGMFDFYEGASRTATCVDDINAARKIANGRPIFAQISPTKLVNVTNQAQ